MLNPEVGEPLSPVGHGLDALAGFHPYDIYPQAMRKPSDAVASGKEELLHHQPLGQA
jgi:hypothetical protein